MRELFSLYLNIYIVSKYLSVKTYRSKQKITIDSMNIPIINNTRSYHLKLNKMITHTRHTYVKNISNLNSYVKLEINYEILDIYQYLIQLL